MFISTVWLLNKVQIFSSIVATAQLEAALQANRQDLSDEYLLTWKAFLSFNKGCDWLEMAMLLYVLNLVNWFAFAKLKIKLINKKKIIIIYLIYFKKFLRLILLWESKLFIYNLFFKDLQKLKFLNHKLIE